MLNEFHPEGMEVAYREIQILKKGRMVFLDSLREKLEGYMEEADGMGEWIDFPIFK